MKSEVEERPRFVRVVVYDPHRSRSNICKHTDPHTVHGRSTLKDGVCNEHIFRNESFRELKIAKESNDLADLAEGLTRIIPEIK